jgi:hypothetical protein
MDCANPPPGPPLIDVLTPKEPIQEHLPPRGVVGREIPVRSRCGAVRRRNETYAASRIRLTCTFPESLQLLPRKKLGTSEIELKIYSKQGKQNIRIQRFLVRPTSNYLSRSLLSTLSPGHSVDHLATRPWDRCGVSSSEATSTRSLATLRSYNYAGSLSLTQNIYQLG